MQPSLIDTYAGLLLSQIRFLITSVKLLKFTFVHNYESDVLKIMKQLHNHSIAFYYDANLSYWLASCCIWCPGNIGSTVVCCHSNNDSVVLSSQIFQRCLGCKLDRPGLHALVDAYQGCFKNDATDGSEKGSSLD